MTDELKNAIDAMANEWCHGSPMAARVQFVRVLSDRSPRSVPRCPTSAISPTAAGT